MDVGTGAPTDIVIREESARDLGPYAEVSIGFVAERILVPIPQSGPLEFRAESLAVPFRKDYDAEPGHHPSEWPRRFDTSDWAVLSAWRGRARVGGAVLIQGSEQIDMLEGRGDLALIWDLRIAPEHRGCGVGTRIIEAASGWARERGCTELKVETQNINVAACRFYRKCGFTLRSADASAYPELPDEIQMLWYKALDQKTSTYVD